jgi:hypothetical protein
VSEFPDDQLLIDAFAPHGARLNLKLVRDVPFACAVVQFSHASRLALNESPATRYREWNDFNQGETPSCTTVHPWPTQRSQRAKAALGQI